MPTSDPKTLVAQMTLDEKLAQITSLWMHQVQDDADFSPAKAQTLLPHGIGQISRTGGDSILEPAAAARFNNALQRHLRERTRLGIPAIVHEECCSGYVGLGGTMYPQMLGLASTFRPELATRMTREIRKQMRGVGAHQGLGPVLDIGRDPRWGRIEETFGEDATLVSQFGVAYIQGLQGESLSDGVMATAKHFVGHSASQGGQNCAPSRIGANDLWETYLAPFQTAVRDARVAAVMNAYPELDGDLVAASPRILTDLLRRKLGFAGLLVSDYEAVTMIHTFHRAVACREDAARLALTAGIDLELPTRSYYGDPLRAALDAGAVSLEAVDAAVERVLQAKTALGLFENPYVDEGRVPELFETDEQRRLAREIARQSQVLLTNNGVLPLATDLETVAVIGPNAADGERFLGGYSYASMFNLMRVMTPPGSQFERVDPAQIERFRVSSPSFVDALRSKLPTSEIVYARGCDHLDTDESGFAAALAAARAADVVILMLGDRSGLSPTCTVGETRDSADLLLPGAQQGLAEAVLATGKPVVIVLVTGRPYALGGLAERAAAILEAWLPGEEGAEAIVETLLGQNNPGGKLTVTFPRHVGQVPLYYNHKPSAGRSHWWGDYVSVPSSPLFPFGHGLSYTTFAYDDFTLSARSLTVTDTLELSVRITNTGACAGDDVVQLYITDEAGSVPRPVRELKGFQRLSLAPGESRVVTFHLAIAQLAFYDVNLNLIVEPGGFTAGVGASSADIRCRAEFRVDGPTASIAERVFVCPVTVS